ncbi:MAG: tetratricopeptide repeat protein [Acidobacteria bacterium]|nr:tetratricopeptide repeat protein [Acidobacteriota bacterium]
MGDYAILLAALLALLAGLTIGKAWERYKLRDGRWIDRRKARESPHYILGLNFLVSNQIDLAIEELTRAAGLHSDAIEIDMILGNLYREKGQVSRAVKVHQELLQRPKLTKIEHAYVMLCLGLDFKSGGFVDRAFEAFSEVLRLDPKNHYALVNLEKLHEEQHQWQEAWEIRQRLTKAGTAAETPRNQEILAFLENERGLEALKRMDYRAAARYFEAAIDLDRKAVPAYLNLGDTHSLQGQPAKAAEAWEQVARVAPDQAFLAFDRLESIYAKLGTPERFPEMCRRLIAASKQDWRARAALSRHLAAHGSARAALDLLFEALVHNPHALIIHEAIWKILLDLDLDRSLVERYIELTGQAVFYLDPHVCLRCRYRSTELLWQCPHCREWNTFVEDRIAPAQDAEEAGELGRQRGPDATAVRSR